mgnify:FL=1
MNKKELNDALKRLDSVGGINDVLKIISKLNVAGRDLVIKAMSEQMTQAKKQQFLSVLRSQAANADNQLKEVVARGLTNTYVAGMNQAQTLFSDAVKKGTASFPANSIKGKITVQILQQNADLRPHLDAVTTLISDAYLNFGDTMAGFVKGAERIFNEQLKQQVRSTIANGRLEGASVDAIKETLKEQFSQKGFTVLLDKAGKQWELERYSEMLARTHIIKANNEAVVNRSSDLKVDIVEVSSSIGSTDPLCTAEEGKLYSISGNSENYPPLQGHEPPFHPNCRHSLLLRPDLS